MRRVILGSSAPLLLIALISFACGGSQPGEPQTVRVENPTLGLAIAALPEGFEVVTAEGDTIELRSSSEEGEGHAVVRVGEPRPHGVNLVEEVKARKAEFESLPGGAYLGNRELGTPTGTAFTARGTYQGDAGEVEETWVYALHPSQRDRLMTLTYSYPAGNSEQRVNELLLLLGEIEGSVGAPSEGS